MGRKNEILLEIKEAILKTLYQYCNKNYYDESNINLEIDIVFKNEIITSSVFDVSVCVLELGSIGGYEYPSFPDIVQFRLNFAKIETLTGTNGRELVNIKTAINQLLSEAENEILNY